MIKNIPLPKFLITQIFSKKYHLFTSTLKAKLNILPPIKTKKKIPTPSTPKLNLYSKSSFFFSQDKKQPLKPEQIPAQNLQVVQTDEKIQNQQIQVFHTKGTLSILDKVPGTKTRQSGDLYVLMFTCGQCNAKQIKSFTKNAYHKGVVLARCIGCEKVHLVADNLGWFQDQPTNVQTLHKEQIKKVHDHAAISAFLKKAFSEEQELLKSPSNSKDQAKDQINEQKKN